MEVLLLSFLTVILQAEWNMSEAQTNSIVSSVFIGALAGTLTLGPLGDRIGRKPVFTVTAAIICLFGLLTAACNTVRTLKIEPVLSSCLSGQSQYRHVRFRHDDSPGGSSILLNAGTVHAFTALSVRCGLWSGRAHRPLRYFGRICAHFAPRHQSPHNRIFLDGGHFARTSRCVSFASKTGAERLEILRCALRHSLFGFDILGHDFCTRVSSLATGSGST